MSWTQTTLNAAIRSYLETEISALPDTDIDVIVLQAEDRILKNVQLPEFRKNVTGSLTGSDQYLAKPDDFLSPYSLAVDNSGLEFLLFKEVNFIREAYPSTSSEGTPKYYSAFEGDFFLLGPTPDQAYAVELHYFYKPVSITTGVTTWLGDNAESTLLYGCLVEAYTFLKGDADMMQVYEARYKEALAALQALSFRNTTDSYRRAG